MTILDEIFAHKRHEVAERMRRQPMAAIQAEAEKSAPAQDFIAALHDRSQANSRPDGAGGRFTRSGARPLPALIAEIKYASPSKGVLLRDRDPCDLAHLYQENGAAALSILTDESYFQGSFDYLRQVARQETGLPILCKDFIWHPYQVYEARAAGADAVLLIAAGLDAASLFELHRLVNELGMAALIEVPSSAELELALACQPRLIGINNRDLHSFQVDLGTTLRLCPSIPAEICVVSESGIQTHLDAECLAEAGVAAILVGEALVSASDIGAAVRELAGRWV